MTIEFEHLIRLFRKHDDELTVLRGQVAELQERLERFEQPPVQRLKLVRRSEAEADAGYELASLIG